MAACQLTRKIAPGAVHHDVSVDVSGNGIDVEWLYVGMLPFVHWDGEAGTTVVDTLTSDTGAVVSLPSYAAQSGLQVDFASSRKMGLTGATPQADIVYGHEAGAVPALGNRLAQFDAFVLPNIDGQSANGSQDWPAKAYVRAQPQGALTLQNGDMLHFFSRHVLTATA